ncbi:hypothetical protein JCM16358_02450 [Halanaerocella petrolearia]
MRKIISLILVISLGLLVGCSSVTDDDLTSGDSGSLAMSISDAPVNDVESVFVSLEEVEVHNTDTGWETVNDFESNDYTDGELKVDLLQLRFDDKLLGQKSLPSGTYDQIRLIVAANENGKSTGPNSGKSYVVYKDGSESDIFIPSGTQTGLKINHNFTIEESKITRLLLDSDVSKIMHTAGKSGKIILRPTAIDIIDQVVSGDVEGRVLADVDGNGTVGTDETISNYDVSVEVYDKGDDPTKTEPIKSTVATVEDMDTDNDGTIDKKAGSYLLRGLTEGDYTIYAKVVTGEDADRDGTIDQVLNSNNEPLYQLQTTQSVTVVAEDTTPVDTLKFDKVTVDTTDSTTTQ